MCLRGMQKRQSQETERSEGNDYDLFASLYPSLRRFAAVVGDSDMDPDDLVQDALAAMLERHDVSDIRQTGPYLKQAIVNAVASRRRRSGLWRVLIPRLARETTTVDTYPSDLAILDQLAPLDRAVVFLIDVEGLPSSEAAEHLGLTSAATRKRVSRARTRLRTILGQTLTIIENGPEASR